MPGSTRRRSHAARLISDGAGASPIRDALSGRTTTVNGREPLSFGRVVKELTEDAFQIASYLRDLPGPMTAWSMMRRAEALVGKDGITREQAVKQADYWGGGE